MPLAPSKSAPKTLMIVGGSSPNVDFTAATLNCVMGVLLAGGAYVQFNDPDPALWIASFESASIACFVVAAICLGLLPKIPTAMAPLLIGLFAIPLWLFAAGFPVALKAMGNSKSFREFVEVEEVRETFGQLWVMGWLAVSLPYSYLRPGSIASDSSAQSGSAAAGSSAGDPAVDDANAVDQPKKEFEAYPTLKNGSASWLSTLASGPVLFTVGSIAAWAGWVAALHGGHVNVVEHCQGLL